MADVELLLTDDPAQACAKMNAHNHGGALGTQIQTEGLDDGVVTEPKMANAAVSSRTIQPGAVGMTALDEEVKEMVQAGGSEGIPGLTNFIAEGMKFTPGAGLAVSVQPGRCSIAEKTCRLTSAYPVDLDARMASLLFAQKQTDTTDPIIGKINAVYPEPDDATIAQWRFNLNGDQDVPNYAVGRSIIAVENVLVHNGGLTRVDGYVDYAIKGDGSTGFYNSQNSTGIPTGAAVREIDVFLTATATGIQQHLCGYGTSSGSPYFIIMIHTNNNLCVYAGGVVYDSSYTVETGKTYLVSVLYDGVKVYVYVNGSLVYTVAVTLATAASNFYIMRNPTGSQNFSNSTLHFVEIRNALRTPAQIAAIANRLCLPCRYTSYAGSYPTISASDLASAYHEWKFNETSGSAVADSAGTLNGTATGTTIVDSDIIPGAKARKFNGTSDSISVGAMSFGSAWTVIGVIKLESYTGNSNTRALLGNYNGTTGQQFGVGDKGTVCFVDGATRFESTSTPCGLGAPVFLAGSYNGSMVTLYGNSPYPIQSVPAAYTPVNNMMVIGRGGSFSSSYMAGAINYLLYFPRALSQPEIAQIYNALMHETKRNIIDDMIPADAISLGFVRTGSSGILEYNDSYYKYGRREKAVGGNRRVFCDPGWQYFNGVMNFDWINHFDTRKMKTYYVWAQDAGGTNECRAYSRYSNSSSSIDATSAFGITLLATSSSPLRIQTNGVGVVRLNGDAKNSGYIGCYAEVLEDD